jgi:large subunit ribosomal protein L15
MSDIETTGPIGLHQLTPAPGSRRARKRVGRGLGSGSGKTAGRGQKGQKSRSGSHMMRPGFEGGQNPLNMLLGKQRGPHKKTSMPFGPFRTVTTSINLRDIARRVSGDVEVTPESLLAAKVIDTLAHPVKVLAIGECSGAWKISAHKFSAEARRKIEAAGGTVTLLAADEDEAPAKGKAKPKAKAKTTAEAAPAEAPPAVVDEAPAEEAPVAEEAPAAEEAPEEPAAEAEADDAAEGGDEAEG